MTNWHSDIIKSVILDDAERREFSLMISDLDSQLKNIYFGVQKYTKANNEERKKMDTNNIKGRFNNLKCLYEELEKGIEIAKDAKGVLDIGGTLRLRLYIIDEKYRKLDEKSEKYDPSKEYSMSKTLKEMKILMSTIETSKFTNCDTKTAVEKGKCSLLSLINNIENQITKLLEENEIANTFSAELAKNTVERLEKTRAILKKIHPKITHIIENSKLKVIRNKNVNTILNHINEIKEELIIEYPKLLLCKPKPESRQEQLALWYEVDQLHSHVIKDNGKKSGKIRSQVLDNCDRFKTIWRDQWCISFEQIDQSLKQRFENHNCEDLTSSELHRISRILEKQAEDHILQKGDVSIDVRNLEYLRKLLDQRKGSQQTSRKVLTETNELTHYNIERALKKADNILKNLYKHREQQQGQASNLVDSSQSHGVACREATVNSIPAQLDACPPEVSSKKSEARSISKARTEALW